MLEDKIIVQDRGFDAGLAALMQNANKNMDPAALMTMMNNNGFGGNGGWLIWIILLFFVWGGWGNGFGNRGAEASQFASQLNTDANTNLLMQAINGNKEAISTLSNTLNCDINSLQNALNAINTSVSQISCDTKLTGAQVINAIQSGDANLASQLASCCCDVRNAITTQGYESQLAIVNQTNALNANTNTHFNILGSKIDAQTQMINDRFCQLEMREMQNKIDNLRDEKQAYQLSALTQQQTQNLIGQLKPTPVPAYITCNPYGYNSGFTNYGYGYADGYGCGY